MDRDGRQSAAAPPNGRSRRSATADEGELSPELIEGWALAYLGSYASSAENLRRVLRRRVRRRGIAVGGADDPIAAMIDALVERYTRSGLLDDDAYAAARVRSLHRRGESMTRIRARLAAKGVDGAVAATAVLGLRGETADPDLAAACAFARRRRLGPYRRSAADPARELGAFARAGFGRRVAERVLACADIDAVEALVRGERD